MAGLNRFFVKLAHIYCVYDRETGTMIGSTIVDAEVVKRVLAPKGFHAETRADPALVKIPVGSETTFHEIFRKIRYSTPDDKAYEEKLHK